MRLSFKKSEESAAAHKPVPTQPPHMRTTDLAALYRAARVGGDFFEFIQVGPHRLIFTLLDIAGKREQALDIAASIQASLRSMAVEKFTELDINEADAVTDLVHHLNSCILEAAGGVRCAAGFVACYNESNGILSYINAGHVPALVRDNGSIQVLEASGLPLGLFSHATHDCQVCALQEEASLLLASRGLLEVRAGGEEFGIDRLKTSFNGAPITSAHDLCSTILRDVGTFVEQQNSRGFLRRLAQPRNNGDGLGENDITTVGLIRSSAKFGVAAAAR